MISILANTSGTTAGDRALGSQLAALGLHMVLLGLAVGLTNRPAAGPEGIRIPLGPVVWRPATRDPAPQRRSPPTPSNPAPAALDPTLVVAVHPPADLPAIPGVQFVPGAWPFAHAPVDVPPGITPAAKAPVNAAVVEEVPRLVSHPAPRYPELLRQAGVEGRVVFEVVLDTAGRAEPATLRVLTSTHRLFEGAGADVVLGSVYTPGRVAGRAVRTLIQVPVAFALRRR